MTELQAWGSSTRSLRPSRKPKWYVVILLPNWSQPISELMAKPSQNRLLQMIRQQQLQLQQLQASQGQAQSSVPAEDHPPIISDPFTSTSHPLGAHSSLSTPSGSVPRSPTPSHPRSSFDIVRDAPQRRSRPPSRGASSPRLRSTSISQEGEPHLSGVRDETTYYQAETQSLIRENQMLRHRIRELGKISCSGNLT